MRRHTSFFILLVAVLTGMPEAALAQGGGKGWIERLSGPGPWHGVDVFSPVGCIRKNSDNNNRPAPLWDCYRELKRNENPAWFFDFEFGDYKSEDDPVVNHTTVNLKRWELRATTFVGSTSDVVEVGFGAGAFHFSGNFDAFAKLALPVRVAAYPLNAFTDKPWGTVFAIWAKQTFLPGRINGADFGVPNSSFDESWEAVSSYGLVVDLRVLVIRLF